MRERVWSFPSRNPRAASAAAGVFVMEDWVVTKSLKNEGFKQQKLTKTRARRETLARNKQVADLASTAKRNDLLPRLAIRECRIDALKPPSRRVRKDDPNQIRRIVASYCEHGVSQPILVRQGQVIDGWLRVLAGKELGLEHMPVIECDHLSAAQARTLALAANRIGELGAWDLDALHLEFQELQELKVDLDVTGFTVQEQDIILLDPLEGTGKSDPCDEVGDVPEHPAARSGDIWVLGNHRLICGDARDKLTYEALLGGSCVHAVLTDAPYNVKIKGNVSGLGKKVHDEFAMASGEMSDAQFQEFLDQVLRLLATSLVPGGVAFGFMDWRSIHRLYLAGERADLKLVNLAVWFKQVGGMGSLYRSAHELVAVFCKGETPRVNHVELGRHGRDRANVWIAPGANRSGSSASEMLDSHATPKPVELCVDAILDVTNPGEIVLDAFLGSGTTLIAADKTGRHCRGIEIEPRFVDVTIARWEKLTGQQALLEATGETFAEVGQRRQEGGAA